MPIKHENKARYPADWPAVRQVILTRAGNCCEQCGARHRTMIARGVGDDADTYMTDDAEVYDADAGEHLGQRRMSEFNVGRMVDVVLTIGHLDHTPENCDPANLKAWCQRCHLRYDAKHHAETARVTRRSRKAVGDMFDEAAGATALPTEAKS